MEDILLDCETADLVLVFNYEKWALDLSEPCSGVNPYRAL